MQLLCVLGTLLLPLDTLILECNNFVLEVSDGLSLKLKVEGEDIPHRCGVHQHKRKHALSEETEHLHVLYHLQQPQKLAHDDLSRVSREQDVGERHTLTQSRVKWVHGWEQPQRSEHHLVRVLLAEGV
jgi:hypothetical protein